MSERKKRAKPAAKPAEPFRSVVETFSRPWNVHVQTEPSCFNGAVSIKRYRVTVEEIVEPVEVYAERLQLLWDHCDNHHHVFPLRHAAKLLGVSLVGDRGTKRKAKP